MSDLLQWIAILAAEILAVIFIILLLYWFKQSAKQRRDKKAVAELVEKTLAAKTQRAEVIEAYLSSNMALSGDALNKTTKNILREEMRLIQDFANVYRNHDTGAAGLFHIAVENAVMPYHGLTAGASAASEDDIDPDEMAALRAENVRLSEELAVTMDTMTRMLEEYSTMFSGASPDSSAVMPDDEPESDEVSVEESVTSSDIDEAEEAMEDDLEDIVNEIEQAATEDDVLDDLFDTDDLDELEVPEEGADDDNKTFVV